MELDELETPALYIDLMNKCWDSNPENRPSSDELNYLNIILYEWYSDILDQKDTEFYNQVKEVGNFLLNLMMSNYKLVTFFLYKM